MRGTLSTVTALALLALSTHASPLPQPREQVLRCTLDTAEQVSHIETQNLDVWSHHGVSAGEKARPIDVRVNDAQKAALLATGVRCEPFIEDVAALLKEEMIPVSQQTLQKRAAPSDPYFSTYRSFAEINAQIAKWASAYPATFKDLGSVGQSAQGRALRAFKITSAKTGPKKAIWLNGGIHAREWVSSATTMYIAHSLLTAPAGSPAAALLDSLEFYFTPMSNPDGYEYSRTTNRMWRKNRGKNAGSSCIGTDLNRNWDEHWNVVGASQDPCSDTYSGTKAFSAPETLALSKFALSLPNRVAGIDLHSYGQYVLRPWGWTYDAPPNNDFYTRLGDGMRDAIRSVYGTRYTSQSGADLYPAAGATDDWMNAKARMVGFTIELRDTGSYGFALPARLIVPTGEEAFAGVVYYARFVLDNKVPILTPARS
ncbi:putative carboxypeptidase precursor [Powellomyces hirtus]|nr:putative carboxypeptidase precursor [Powellomyces hirtus]